MLLQIRRLQLYLCWYVSDDSLFINIKVGMFIFALVNDFIPRFRFEVFNCLSLAQVELSDTP